MRTSEGRREEERVKDCRPAVGSIDEIPSVWHRCGTRVTTDMELKKRFLLCSVRWMHHPMTAPSPGSSLMDLILCHVRMRRPASSYHFVFTVKTSV